MRLKFSSSSFFFLISLFIFVDLSFAWSSVFNLSFNHQDLVFEEKEGYHLVKMKGCLFSTDLGHPQLPVRLVQIAIPEGLEVERVEVLSFESQKLSGEYKIYPTQPFYPLSDSKAEKEDFELVEPDPSVYGLSSEYPGRLAKVLNNGFLGGQHVAGIALYPLQYIPSEEKLILYTRIEFELVFKSCSHPPAKVNRRTERGEKFYYDLVKSLVINPEDVQLNTRGILPPEEEIEYLIITQSFLVPAFQELASWKIRKGISTEIKELSWIVSNYPGDDDPEKIRNCIVDFYSNHGTRWVLLGGDTQIIPHRLVRVEDEDIPCDLYFSDLDNDWDVNGNQVYGEYEDSVDMYPDVFVGRAPSTDLYQAQTFVNKCLVYETSPPTNYQKRILYAAEEVWVGTDASQLKDYIDTSFVPDYFEDTKLYETTENLNRITFGDALNSGQNIINHNGHGNYNKLSIGPASWFSMDMDNLTNSPRYSLFYSYGCFTSAIDLDCIAEHFVNSAEGGGFAYCGNTRAGWGVLSEPLEGPGAEFDIEFFDALFDKKNHQLGRTLGSSKIPFIPLSQDASGGGPYYRWTMYSLLLLGDPTLELWTDLPEDLSIHHSPVVFVGKDHFEVEVDQDGALTSCVLDGRILGTAYSSGGSAVVYFDSPLIDTGIMQLTVTKHNFLPYRNTVLAIPPEGPYLHYLSHQIDDSTGNGNGVINPGESIHMPVTVKNYGLEVAYGVSGVLREDDDFVVVTDSLRSFGDIDSGMTSTSSEGYVFEVDPFCPDSHWVCFALEIADDETCWASSFYEMVTQPDFIISVIPETAFVHRDDSTGFKVVVNSLGGFNLPVSLDYQGLPQDVSGILEPAQLIPTDSSFLSIFTFPSIIFGTYPFSITAFGEGIIREKEVVLSVITPPYSGPVWHVSTFGDDLVGNGSLEFPFGTIQKGIESAGYHDTVLVEKGVYQEKIDFLGKAILVGSRFIFDGLKSTVDSTLIQWEGEGSVVTFESGEYLSSIIRGFTLTKESVFSDPVIRCPGSSPSIFDNVILGNGSGSGIYCSEGSMAEVKRNLIRNCSGLGAVVLNVVYDARVVNNTICDNLSCGIYIKYSGACIRNNIVCDNGGCGIYVSKPCSLEIKYNDVFNQPENYCGLLEDLTGVNGNISADPLFVDPLTGDFRLTSLSPCIDAGDTSDSIPPEGGQWIDMGAFEYQLTGSRVIYHSHQIDDSSGNDNGVVNPGEVVFISINVKNIGPEKAYNVKANLRTGDGLVLITDSLESFGDLDPGMVRESPMAFSFEVDPFCPDSHQIAFTLQATDEQSLWNSGFSELVVLPYFVMTTIPDTAFVFRNDSVNIELILGSVGGFNSKVGLGFSELPSGTSGLFDPDTLFPPDSSIIKIYTAPDLGVGSFPIIITAFGDGIENEKEFQLEVAECGDVNGDGLIDLADILYLANYYLKMGGPPPEPICRANANGDELLNLADVIYIANYYLKGGPSPHDCENYGQ